ncbi:hypothetical protein C8R48DRAFT_682753 [Suillus tomentosus]|nr:hypothetical protein C8R48DRAFT_682753 [Suillus tomentosus]
MRSQDETQIFLRGLALSRYPDVYHAQLCCGHRRCSSSDCRKRNMHLAAIMELENIIILQNKIDLIKEAQALAHQKSIAAFVKGAVAWTIQYCTKFS